MESLFETYGAHLKQSIIPMRGSQDGKMFLIIASCGS